MHNTNIIISVKPVYIYVPLAYKKEDILVFVSLATVVHFNPSHKRHHVDQKDRKLQKDEEKLHNEELQNCTLHRGESIS
jgi:hypothetical protein